MKSLPRWLVLASLVGCATEETIGSGGEGGVAPVGGSAEGGEAATGGGGTSDVGGAGGAPMGCDQDCSTIEVPLCYEAVCNEESGICEIGPAADDTPCEDDLFCTVDDVCLGGECVSGAARDCTEGLDNPCLIGECHEDLKICGSSSGPNGLACQTDDLCQSNAQCTGGQCLGAPTDCSTTPLTSFDCQAAACDAATGDCVVSSINDGMPCVSGDLCESAKTCAAGVCSGTPIPDCSLCTEMEPNETFSMPNIDATCAAWGGAISVLNDKDCFQVVVTQAGSRIDAEVVDIGGTGCPTGFDSRLRLYDSMGTQLADADEGAVANCSLMGPTTTGATDLDAGTYTVCVEEYLNDETSPPYLLLLDVIPASCGDSIVNGAEECDGTTFDGATCVSEGFVSGTLACNATCAIDTSGCVAAGCGNGLLEPGEDCEGAALGCTACELFTCAPGEVAFDVVASGLPTAIIDNATITSTIAVPGSGTVTAIGLQINVSHIWDEDLDLFLTPPGIAQLELSTDNGGQLDHYTDTVFTTNAAAPLITGGMAPFTGVFRPEGNLGAVIGTPANGNWTLTVTDDAAIIAGTLNSWRVFGCMQP